METSPDLSLQEQLRVLFERVRPTLETRAEKLMQAQQGLERGSLQASERQEAASEAHKLAGVLGTFGLKRGTELALLIERKLEEPGGIEAKDQAQLKIWVEELHGLLHPQRNGPQ